MVAAKAFLASVPDPRVTLPQRLVVSDRVVSHLRFTGSFDGVKGGGQPIAVSATDDPRVRAGRITGNRHPEDNPPS